jgi:protein-disulfide isomerase
MRSIFNRFFGVSAIAMLAAACACQQKAPGGSSSANQIVRPLSENVVIMTFEGGKITAKDVAEQVEPQLKRFTEESVEAYQTAARRILVQKLIEAEAKKQNTNPQALFEQMMAGGEVSEAEIDAFLKTRPDLQKGLKEGMKDPSTGKVQKISRDDLKRFLGGQRSQQAQQNFVEGLLAKANSKMMLDLPRIAVPENAKSPFLGSKDAKVVIHEFSDFECGYCARALPLVKQIKDTYGDKIKFVFRHFPLSFHPHAKPAALATICANEQGKFWELHDKIFENQQAFPQEAGKDIAKGAAFLKKWAGEAGIDVAKMEECIGKPETNKILEQDMADAEKVGVSGTPSFFVNGKKVQAGSFEEFRGIIDQELAKN